MENKEIENAINELIRLKKILLVQFELPQIVRTVQKSLVW